MLFRSLAATGQPSNDLYSPTAQAHIYSSPTLLPLTKKQRRLVMNNPGTIVAVAKGARMAVDECQYQFKDRRWNCSVEVNGHGGSIFGKIIEKGKIITPCSHDLFLEQPHSGVLDNMSLHGAKAFRHLKMKQVCH